MKAFIVFAVAFLALAVESRHHGKPDFHWRDYNGTLPKDALRVLPKGTETPFYVGQGYLEGVGILPGMLVEGVQGMEVVANGKVFTIKDNIKIMATDSANPSNDFQWISTTYENLDSYRALSFLNVPSGGTESQTVVYIGRHTESGYNQIGKIYTVSPYQGLNIPNPQGKPTVYKNFEFLALLNFDCDEPDYYGARSGDSSESSHRMTFSSRRHSQSHGSSWAQ